MMLIDLIAALAMGFAAAGAVLLLRRLLGGRIPGWMAPAAAGLGMIAYTIWAEYSWYARTTAALPDSVRILSAPENRSFYRPWTYLAPLKDRFLAVDAAAVRRNPAFPEQRLVEVMVVARYGAQGRLPVLVDCAENRRADLADGAAFGEDGRISGADWRPMKASDPLLRSVCRPG